MRKSLLAAVIALSLVAASAPLLAWTPYEDGGKIYVRNGRLDDPSTTIIEVGSSEDRAARRMARKLAKDLNKASKKGGG